MLNFVRYAGLIACFYVISMAVIADDDTPKPAQVSAASKSLELNKNAEELAGIKTQPLEAVQQQSEFTAFGNVIDLESLLNMRQHYLAALAQQEGVRAKYHETDINLARTRDLHTQDIVSTRRLQEQQAQWQSEKANLAASGYQQQAIAASSRLQWGNVLTDWFIQIDGKASERFLNQHAQILLITLPANTRLNANTTSLYVDERGRREQAQQATLISPAPQVDPLTQGQRYFFMLQGARSMPFGTQLTAWITNEGKPTSGVIVPESALVWHLGQAVVFIKTGDGKFVRRSISDHTLCQGGYFVAGSSLQADEEIVIAGAQTLLSQELKKLIPSEDND